MRRVIFLWEERFWEMFLPHTLQKLSQQLGFLGKTFEKVFPNPFKTFTESFVA